MPDLTGSLDASIQVDLTHPLYCYIPRNAMSNVREQSYPAQAQIRRRSRRKPPDYIGPPATGYHPLGRAAQSGDRGRGARRPPLARGCMLSLYPDGRRALELASRHRSVWPQWPAHHTHPAVSKEFRQPYSSQCAPDKHLPRRLHTAGQRLDQGNPTSSRGENPNSSRCIDRA